MKCLKCGSEKVRVVAAWGMVKRNTSITVETWRCQICGREWNKETKLEDGFESRALLADGE